MSSFLNWRRRQTHSTVCQELWRCLHWMYIYHAMHHTFPPTFHFHDLYLLRIFFFNRNLKSRLFFFYGKNLSYYILCVFVMWNNFVSIINANLSLLEIDSCFGCMIKPFTTVMTVIKAPLGFLNDVQSLKDICILVSAVSEIISLWLMFTTQLSGFSSINTDNCPASETSASYIWSFFYHSFSLKLHLSLRSDLKADLMNISAFSSADWFRYLVAFLSDGLPWICLKASLGYDTSFCHWADWPCFTYKYVMKKFQALFLFSQPLSLN